MRNRFQTKQKEKEVNKILSQQERIIPQQPELVDVSEVIIDKGNPNKMTYAQQHGLQESMRRFGFLQPIIIDQQNKFVSLF